MHLPLAASKQTLVSSGSSRHPSRRDLAASLRKIPFACSYLPGKGNLHLLFWVFLGFFFPLLHKATDLEREMSTHLNSYAEMILILELLIAVVFCAMKLLISPNDDLIFEEEEPALLVSLNLT